MRDNSKWYFVQISGNEIVESVQKTAGLECKKSTYN